METLTAAQKARRNELLDTVQSDLYAFRQVSLALMELKASLGDGYDAYLATRFPELKNLGKKYQQYFPKGKETA